MSNKWTGLEKPITAELAEREPEAQRLFSRPPRPLSPATRALLALIKAHKAA
jgi:hypothetical protein